MIKVITAPEPFYDWNGGMFLAGTIDNGNSIDWQEHLINTLNENDNFVNGYIHETIINPRRKNWNASIEQSINNPELFQQMSWEKEGLTRANKILFNFLSSSKSPITLLELGLWANSGKCLVICPKEFWRAGNVEFICNEYKIPIYRSMEQFLKEKYNIKKHVERN